MPALLAPPPNPTIEAATRREFLAALTAAGLLAGCGSPSPQPDAPESTRQVDAPTGPAAVPADPRRVVAVNLAIDALTAVGFPRDRIVGSVYLDSSDYLAEHYTAGDTPDLATDDVGLNLELLTALEPDLVIGNVDTLTYTEQGPQILALAPFVGYEYLDWRRHLRGVAAAVGREAAAEDFVAEQEAAIARLADRVAAFGRPITTVVVQPNPSSVLVYNAVSGPGVAALDEAGLVRTPATAALDPGNPYPELSFEQLGLLDADLLFADLSLADGGFAEHPLWRALPAVVAGRVAPFGSHWGYGSGLAIGHVLADIEAGLAVLGA